MQKIIVLYSYRYRYNYILVINNLKIKFKIDHKSTYNKEINKLNLMKVKNFYLSKDMIKTLKVRP